MLGGAAPCSRRSAGPFGQVGAVQAETWPYSRLLPVPPSAGSPQPAAARAPGKVKSWKNPPSPKTLPAARSSGDSSAPCVCSSAHPVGPASAASPPVCARAPRPRRGVAACVVLLLLLALGGGSEASGALGARQRVSSAQTALPLGAFRKRCFPGWCAPSPPPSFPPVRATRVRAGRTGVLGAGRAAVGRNKVTILRDKVALREVTLGPRNRDITIKMVPASPWRVFVRVQACFQLRCWRQGCRNTHP